ncbi:MAG: DUF4256 domain-containing protein [Candidatus Saccharimonadaceae bacterium]
MELSHQQQTDLIETLALRFEKNIQRHPHIEWTKVKSKLQHNPEKLYSLYEMERTGGEPDVVNFDEKSNEYVFYDCSAESPTGRRSLCYDREAWESRKENRPTNNAMDMAHEMGIEMITVDEYHDLQRLGDFDNKSSSWVLTPSEVRKLGGAFFGDFRYTQVFIYHNGAQSYYAGRGFRGSLRV